MRTLILWLLMCSACFAGASLDCDGTDHIEINLPAGTYGTAGRTVMFWFNTDSFDTGTNDAMFGQEVSATAGAQMFIAAEDDGVSVAWASARTIFGKNTLSTGVWYHFAIAIQDNSDTDNANGYIDGELKSVVYEAGTNQTINTTTDEVPSICDRSTTSTNDYDGRIAYVKVFDIELSAGEVLQEMHCINSFHPNLVRQWNLWSTDAKDFSGNGQDGTNSGATVSSDGPPVTLCGQGV